MRAVQVREFGGPEVLRPTEVPDPDTGSSQTPVGGYAERVTAPAASLIPIPGGTAPRRR